MSLCHNGLTAYLLLLWCPLRWRHNGRDNISNHLPHDCFLNRLFRRRSKKTSKLCVTGLCARDSPGTGEFSAQMASNAEMFSFDDVIMVRSNRRNSSFHLLALVSGMHWSPVDCPHKRWYRFGCFLCCLSEQAVEQADTFDGVLSSQGTHVTPQW